MGRLSSWKSCNEQGDSQRTLWVSKSKWLWNERRLWRNHQLGGYRPNPDRNPASREISHSQSSAAPSLKWAQPTPDTKEWWELKKLTRAHSGDLQFKSVRYSRKSSCTFAFSLGWIWWFLSWRISTLNVFAKIWTRASIAFYVCVYLGKYCRRWKIKNLASSTDTWRFLCRKTRLRPKTFSVSSTCNSFNGVPRISLFFVRETGRLYPGIRDGIRFWLSPVRTAWEVLSEWWDSSVR